MKLSIITINFNNAAGLRKTMDSVFAQTSTDFEYIVVDGASTDGSLEVIQQFDLPCGLSPEEKGEKVQLSWISEKDTGIYNAMNKGIKLAKGEYCQFLNSGDLLAAPNVTERMISELSTVNYQLSIIYGNMLKKMPGRILRDRGLEGREVDMYDFYTGTLNHSPAYILRSLFDKYGMYDESLKIVSDWKWYLQVVGLQGIEPVYVDIDVTIFDMNGISNTNLTLNKEERLRVLAEVLPKSILRTFKLYASSIDQVKRLNRYWFTRKGSRFIERVLFKYEKWFKNKEQVF